jgi:3-hydroxymyristoyl/3-hydroxydecanoyl-(acyl carrier protein) dehydratase
MLLLAIFNKSAMYRTLRPSSFKVTTFAMFLNLISARFKQNVYSNNVNFIKINVKTVINAKKKRKKSFAAKRQKVSLSTKLTIVTS